MIKKILFSLVALALIVPVVSLAAPSYFSRTTLNGAQATTSVVFMTPGTATSTLTLNTQESDLAALFIQYTASTSAGVLNWKYQYSNNGVDWFEEDNILQAVGSSNIDHASTSVNHVWRPGSTVASTSRKLLVLPPSIAGWTRIVFTLPIGTVNASLYAEGVVKRNAQ